MGTTKPLHPNCEGGIFCPVEGHVERITKGGGRFTIRHIPLTRGQDRELDRRREAKNA
jgi:hypothetical protein